MLEPLSARMARRKAERRVIRKAKRVRYGMERAVPTPKHETRQEPVVSSRLAAWLNRHAE